MPQASPTEAQTFGSLFHHSQPVGFDSGHFTQNPRKEHLEQATLVEIHLYSGIPTLILSMWELMGVGRELSEEIFLDMISTSKGTKTLPIKVFEPLVTTSKLPQLHVNSPAHCRNATSYTPNVCSVPLLLR